MHTDVMLQDLYWCERPNFWWPYTENNGLHVRLPMPAVPWLNFKTCWSRAASYKMYKPSASHISSRMHACQRNRFSRLRRNTEHFGERQGGILGECLATVDRQGQLKQVGGYPQDVSWCFFLTSLLLCRVQPLLVLLENVYGLLDVWPQVSWLQKVEFLVDRFSTLDQFPFACLGTWEDQQGWYQEQLLCGFDPTVSFKTGWTCYSQKSLHTLPFKVAQLTAYKNVW